MKDAIFREGENCWKADTAGHVSVIVDYGNYYRDLHESISKARKSIFVLGWDIDSRIELLRGKDAEGVKEINFFDLVCKKARENPELQIYLNRWDYSVVFMGQRELFWTKKWKSCGYANIHVCMDNVLPLSACHHQKIVVIDDEIAYWGGMDVALGRWDFREHHVRNENRADPALLPSLNETEKFDPYHDIQAVLSGSPARSLARWVRKRWVAACPSIEPVSLAQEENTLFPLAWPDSETPDFVNSQVAIARTMPLMRGERQIEEIYQLLLDEIAQAEKFIYIENQFLACADIAHALNRRLKERPRLKILAVSCFDPNGTFERIAMWGGRVRFTDITTDGVGDRVALAYPLCQENDREAVIRIHSKLMVIDDRYLHIGSANINNRSMGMDTECDVSLYGATEKERQKISSIRNDLIREHTGYSAEYIQDVIENRDLRLLLLKKPGSRQHLHEINDEAYRDQPLWKLIYKFVDPRRPPGLTLLPHWLRQLPVRDVMKFLLSVAAVLGLVAVWRYSPLAAYTDIETLYVHLQSLRETPFALLWILLIYIVGGLVFFPVTAISAAVILLFGGLRGFLFSMVGSLVSAVCGYMIGKFMGKERVTKLFPSAKKAMNKVRDSGVIGVTVIRMLPIAPYSLANIILGVIKVPFLAFIVGTALGMTPGKTVLAFFGESFIDAFKQPSMENMIVAGIGVTAWIGVILFSNKLLRRWQARQEQVS